MVILTGLNLKPVNLFFTDYRNGSFRLKIRMVELSDAGWYICVANNSFGRAQTQAYLTVNSVNPKSTPHKPTLGEWLKKVL